MKAIQWRGKRKASFGASSSEATLVIGGAQQKSLLPKSSLSSGVVLFVSPGRPNAPKCSFWPNNRFASHLVILFLNFSSYSQTPYQKFNLSPKEKKTCVPVKPNAANDYSNTLKSQSTKDDPILSLLMEGPNGISNLILTIHARKKI